MIVRPDYAAVNKKRQERFMMLSGKPELIQHAWDYYETRPVEFIEDWGITYDPRNAGTGIPTMMPFVLFPRQKELIEFLYGCMIDQEAGAIEKCRDAGATWVSCNFSIWCWLFQEGSSIGWGSRKESLVDKLGDPDSIFEKIRMIMKGLPNFFKPEGYKEREHSLFMRLINPENKSTITGEAGDNIGRGGRKTVYFKDESAHYERPETIEAALGDNTNVQIDISSVNGPSTVFQRRVESGENWESGRKPTPGATRIFIFDWRDHPFKDQEWYDRRKEKARKEGLLHIFAQEVDRDSTSAVDGILIPGAWVKAAVDAHIKLGIKISGAKSSALDVADGGQDRNALANRFGVYLKSCVSWPDMDAGKAAQKAAFQSRKFGSKMLQYDSIGVGAGAKTELNRLSKQKIIPESLKILGWSSSSSVLMPRARVIKSDKTSPRNKDFYVNLKAQGWWQLRLRFERTYLAVEEGDHFDPDEIISINGNIEKLSELLKELSQPTYTTNGAGKIIVDKKPKGSLSPNRADAVMMVFWPVKPRVVLM